MVIDEFNVKLINKKTPVPSFLNNKITTKSSK